MKAVLHDTWIDREQDVRCLVHNFQKKETNPKCRLSKLVLGAIVLMSRDRY